VEYFSLRFYIFLFPLLIFEQMLQDMIEEFPHMANVLVTERDIYISGFLQRVMKTPVYLPGQGEISNIE